MTGNLPNWPFIFALSLLVGFAQQAIASKLESTIRIGEIGATTGSEASYGVATHQGVAMAVKEINKSGGLLGKRLKLIHVDSKGNREDSLAAATRLVKEEGVVALIGETASTRTVDVAEIAQKLKVPMISPSATNPKVTAVGDYIFRVCFIDPFQGQAMAKFARQRLRVEKIGVLYDEADNYSSGLAQNFSKSFVELGGGVVTKQTYKTGDIDFKSQLVTLSKASPQAIFIPGYYSQVGLISRQARGVGIKVPLLGGDGWDSPNLVKIGGKAIEGGYFTNHYSPEMGTQRGRNFVRRFRKLYRSIPSGLAAMGYDAMMVLADAIKRAASTEPAAIREALSGTKNFPGVTGTITIDASRNAVKPAVIMKILNGGFVYESTIRPG